MHASSPEVGLRCWLITAFPQEVLPRLFKREGIGLQDWDVRRTFLKDDIDTDRGKSKLGEAILGDIAHIDFERHPNYTWHLSRFFFDEKNGLWNPTHFATKLEEDGSNKRRYLDGIDSALERLEFERRKFEGGTEGIKRVMGIIEQYLKETKTCLENLEFPINQPSWGKTFSDEKEEPLKEAIRFELSDYCKNKSRDQDICIAEGSSLMSHSYLYGDPAEIRDGLDAIISKARKNAPGITLGLYRERLENEKNRITLTIQDAGEGFNISRELESDTGAELALIKRLGEYYCKLKAESSYSGLGERVKDGYQIVGKMSRQLAPEEINEVSGTKYTLEFRVVESVGVYP